MEATGGGGAGVDGKETGQGEWEGEGEEKDGGKHVERSGLNEGERMKPSMRKEKRDALTEMTCQKNG